MATTTDTPLVLGTRVHYDTVLRRTSTMRPASGRFSVKSWERMRLPEFYARPAIRRAGTLVGRRRFSNGETARGWEDTPTTYKANEHFTAALVAYGLRQDFDRALLTVAEVATAVDDPSQAAGMTTAAGAAA